MAGGGSPHGGGAGVNTRDLYRGGIYLAQLEQVVAEPSQDEGTRERPIPGVLSNRSLHSEHFSEGGNRDGGIATQRARYEIGDPEVDAGAVGHHP